MNPASWDGWVKLFESEGFMCHTPAYPFHEGAPEELRLSSPPGLGTLTFKDVIDHLSKFIDTLPEKPYLVGHSMGGLAVQVLLQAGKAKAGVAIDSAPPQGINTLKWSFLKSNLPTINPFKGNQPFLPSVKWFQYAFCNTMSLEEATVEYEKFVVPESRNIPRSRTGPNGKIDFGRPHAPLLMIAGEEDHIIPESLNKANFEAYTDIGSVRQFRVFPGRTHYLCNQPGWEPIADFVAGWLLDR